MNQFMSVLLASPSLRPLVTSGTAFVRPFVPVEAPTPVPSRRNHASTVQVGTESVAAAPNVT
jgi:hypothetical protein